MHIQYSYAIVTKSNTCNPGHILYDIPLHEGLMSIDKCADDAVRSRPAWQKEEQ